MEFVVYVSIGVMCVSILVGVIGLSYWLYDKKRREQQEQEEASPSVVPQ